MILMREGRRGTEKACHPERSRRISSGRAPSISKPPFVKRSFGFTLRASLRMTHALRGALFGQRTLIRHFIKTICRDTRSVGVAS